MNRDRMNNAPAAAVAECAMAVIDAVQTRRADVRAPAVGAALLLLVEHLKLTPQDLMTVVGNMLTGPDGRRVAEFRAVQLYIQNEVTR